MEPKTVNQYLDQLLSLPEFEKDSEVIELVHVIERIKFDFGGNKLLNPLISRGYYSRLRTCLKLGESK